MTQRKCNQAPIDRKFRQNIYLATQGATSSNHLPVHAKYILNSIHLVVWQRKWQFSIKFISGNMVYFVHIIIYMYIITSVKYHIYYQSSMFEIIVMSQCELVMLYICNNPQIDDWKLQYKCSTLQISFGFKQFLQYMKMLNFIFLCMNGNNLLPSPEQMT